MGKHSKENIKSYRKRRKEKKKEKKKLLRLKSVTNPLEKNTHVSTDIDSCDIDKNNKILSKEHSLIDSTETSQEIKQSKINDKTDSSGSHKATQTSKVKGNGDVAYDTDDPFSAVLRDPLYKQWQQFKGLQKKIIATKKTVKCIKILYFNMISLIFRKV